MCLITYSPKGPEILDWEVLDYSRKHMNDDGFGIAWYDWTKEVWKTSRSMRSHKLFDAVSRLVPSEAPVIIHQRFRTHGSVSMDNVHPFPIGATGSVLFHNGSISGTRADYKGARLSDTRAYIEDELAPILEASGTHILLKEKVQDAIGARIGGSVLAITIPGDPTPVIVNEWRGDWEKGLYYSNTYARPYKTSHTGYGYYRNGVYVPSKELSEKYGFGWEWEDDQNAPAASSTTDEGEVIPLDRAFARGEEIADRAFASDYEEAVARDRDEVKTAQDAEWEAWLAEQDELADLIEQIEEEKN